MGTGLGEGLGGAGGSVVGEGSGSSCLQRDSAGMLERVCEFKVQSLVMTASLPETKLRTENPL